MTDKDLPHMTPTIRITPTIWVPILFPQVKIKIVNISSHNNMHLV